MSSSAAPAPTFDVRSVQSSADLYSVYVVVNVSVTAEFLTECMYTHSRLVRL